MNSQDPHRQMDAVHVKLFRQFWGLVSFLVLFILLLFLYIGYFTQPATWWSEWLTAKPQPSESIASTLSTNQAEVLYWVAPDIESLNDEGQKLQLRYGRELVAHTAQYFGPNGSIEANKTNGLNCQNCHLEAGTKVFGNNYSRVAATYPKVRARSGQVEDVYKRINDCFERSLNGQALAVDSKEMQAMAAYIQFLGKDVPKGEKPPGSGFKDLAFLNRPLDPIHGESVYVDKCVSCHQADGQGLKDPNGVYTYPPLWGPLSYNQGAGLYRMSNFAKYVKWNMPLGINHDDPELTDEEAWDVAAWVNTQPRPGKDLSQDWPDIAKKPYDHPFGPYADGFSEEQHKLGPFGPIKAKLEALATGAN
jgi:thiosulfate dehydrogenase